MLRKEIFKKNLFIILFSLAIAGPLLTERHSASTIPANTGYSTVSTMQANNVDYTAEFKIEQQEAPNIIVLKFGIKPNATDGFDDGLDQIRTPPNLGQTDGYFDESFGLRESYKANGSVKDWSVVVVSQSTFPGQADNLNPVRLSWTIPSIGSVPSNSRFRLLDENGNEVVSDMRTTLNTMFAVNAAGTQKRYTIRMSLDEPTCPTINNISPMNGAVGSTVTITGNGFTGVTTVKFTNNVTAASTVNSNTQITATVPVSAITGPITIGKPSCPDAQTATFTVNCPTITVNPATLPNGTVGIGYNQTVSATGGTAPYNFSVSVGTLPNGLSLNALTGAITGTPTIAAPFNFTIKATDANGCIGTRDYTLVIGACPTITLNPTTLPNGTLGANYNQMLSATGGGAPYNFTLMSGTLPPGLNLATNGAISGTPTAAGTFGNIVIKATDANNCPGTQTYSIMITCPTITVNPATLPSGTQNTSYNQTLTATGGTAPYSFAVTAGALPDGLTFSSNGTLSGTPTVNGSFNFTATATDANGCVGSRAYTLVVIDPCPTITLNPSALPPGAVGGGYSQTITASGGAAPYSFTLLSGALPGGLNLAANGNLNGTPTQGGNFNFTVKATDANNCIGTRSYPLTINKANSTTSLVSSANPSVFGQSVTYTATVAANPPATSTPSGTVTFKDGATTLCASTLNGSGSATCLTDTLAVGAHSITAVYGGDNNFNGSDSSPLSQTVNKAGASAILTSSRNPSVEGEQVTFSATVSAVAPGKGTPTGAVTFKDGATTICTSNLNVAGRADCKTSSLAIGAHQITAAYNGDGNFTGSASQALQQTVNPGNADLAVAISASPGTVSNNVRVTYDITVTNKGPGDATQVVVTDNLPASVSFISCSATNGGVCNGSGNNRTVTFASLPRGTSATIRLEASVNCANVSIAGISNTVSVSSAIPDPNLTDNSATAAVNAAPGQTKLTLSNGGNSLDFGTVTVNLEPNLSSPSHTFTLENTGCTLVVVTLAISRTGADVSSGKITNPDDSAAFPITLINNDGTETPLVFVVGSAQLQINGGQQLRFRIAFSPLIPAPAGGVSNLSAGHVLPPEITSALAIRQDNGIQTTVPLIGRISTAAKMINPLATRLSPLVALARSGDEFVVEFSVFDSNLDCYLAVYQFLDSLGRNVGEAPNFDLEQAIRQSGMLRGQSFTVVKRFTGALSLPQVNKVRVTLYDREGNESVLSGEIDKVIGRVVNVSAASFQEVGLASEAITSAFGSGLAASTQAATSSPLPTSLAGTRVFVRDSANVERLAPLFFVAPGQINYQIPRGTSTGPATVTVALNNQAMASATAQVAAASPGLFAANANGQGVAAAVALRVKADGSQSYEPVSVFDQAQNRFVSRPISLGADGDQVYLVLFGTGIRNRSALSNVTARIGGVDVPALYAGSQEGFVGLDQINLLLPRSLAGRGEVDILLILDGKPSNAVKVNID